MSNTAYGVNANETVKLWRKKLFVESLKACYIGKFIGKDDNALVHFKDDTTKGPGDRIRQTLRMQLTGDGISGDNTLEGNEENLTTYTDDITIDQLRHAVRSEGQMSEQRIPFSVRENAKNGLRDWWADRIDTWFFNQVCGFTPQTNVKFTGMQAVTAPSSGRQVWIDASANDQSMDSADTFGLTVIDKAVAVAKTATPALRPVKVPGLGDYYVAFLHPYQVYNMKRATAAAEWSDYQKAAMMGGKVSNNPIFTGALGVYNNVVLHETTRVTNGVNSSTGAEITTIKRAVLCGAQAAGIAFGQDNGPDKMTWVEELFDYGNQLGVSAGAIAGLKKHRFNSTDFGVVVMSTYGAAP